MTNTNLAHHDEAMHILRRHFKMILAITDYGKSPNTSVMHYAVGDSYPTELYFGTCKAFEKYKLIKQEPEVSCVIMEEENSDPIRAISIHGKARELSDIEQELARALFKANNDTRWYIEGRDDIVMFAIRPTSMRVLDGSSGTLEVREVELG